MAKYVIKFSKEGAICYTSHLDILRLFQRSFKKAKLRLAHTQGFNPHPKMSFAQPLALGYISLCEYLEFETEDFHRPEDVKRVLQKQMPIGIRLLDCYQQEKKGKSLAARTSSAEYKISVPLNQTDQVGQIDQQAGKKLTNPTQKKVNDLCCDFLAQNEILASKREKKSKTSVQVNIRDKIQNLDFSIEGQTLIIKALLDTGSKTNLSPELLIAAIISFLGLSTNRTEIEVTRTEILFTNIT